MRKVVFVLSSLQAARSFKRIREFQSRGYQFDVYGFSRDIGKIPDIPCTELGIIINGSSYFMRLKKIYTAVKKLKKQYKHEHCLFYCFGFEIALFAMLLDCKPYIYESSDLMYTHMNHSLIIEIFKLIDRFLIKKSLLTVITSQGFINYLYKKSPNNLMLVTNRLNTSILSLLQDDAENTTVDINHLRLCFCGDLRYKSLLDFAKIVADRFPNITINFYGTVIHFKNDYAKLLEQLKSASNIHFYGIYKNPDDLPGLYSQNDMTLCSYDIDILNDRLLEPNKLYEAIFFRKPIIVSEGTFLAKRVAELGVGYAIDPLNPVSIIKLLTSITKSSLNEKIEACTKIPKLACINNNDLLFARIEKLL